MRGLVTDEECDFIKWEHEERQRIILKFLRARKFNVEQAHAFWKESIQFRKDFNFAKYRSMKSPYEVHGFPDEEFVK